MNVIIIDDEFKPADHLKEVAKKHCGQIKTLEYFQNPVDALVHLKTHPIDLIFLDVEMPEMSGFEFLEIVGPEQAPSVIFTTAYHKYAVQAFKVNAVDYLLKPINPRELVEAVNRAEESQPSDRMQGLNALVKQKAAGFGDRIALAEGQSYNFVGVDEIIRVEGSGSYSHFFLDNGNKITTSKRLNVYHQRLEHHGFVRTHQSHLININYVRSYHKADGGEILMKNGDRVPLSAKLKDDVKEALGLR